jgi:WD40 repeat protein
MSGDIFSIRVIGSTELFSDNPLKNVIVRTSIANLSTGNLLEKSNPESKSLSQHEVTKYLPQCSTKPIPCCSIRSLSAIWKETFLFNEPVETILLDDTILIFEIIDQTIHPKRTCFNSIAWAFLKIKDQNGEPNFGRPAILQLFSYPPKFDATIHGCSLPVLSLLSKRTHVNARLTVRIDVLEPQPFTEVTTRPLSVFEHECGKENDTGASDSDSDPPLDRAPPRKCAIPRRLAGQIPAGENGILSVRFNQAGTYLAAALQINGEYCIQLYQTTDLSLVQTVAGHIDLIYELAFSADGNRLLSVSSDGMAKIWAVPKLSLLSSLPHAGYVYTGKFHPKKEFVATGGIDGVLRIWKANGDFLLHLSKHQSRINSLVFSPNGQRMFTGDATGVIGVWNVKAKKGEITVESVRVVTHREIQGICITHLSMGRNAYALLVVTQDSIVRSFETDAMEVTQRFPGAKCTRYRIEAAFSPDGAHVFAGSETGGVMLWSVHGREPEPVVQWNEKFAAPVTSIAWNPQIDMVAFASFAAGQSLLVFDADQNRPRGLLTRQAKRRRKDRQPEQF